eukprot:4522229-Amphidinium_carterae.1
MPAIADEFVGNTTNGFKTIQIVWNNFWDRVCKLSNLVKATGSGKFEEPATGSCGQQQVARHNAQCVNANATTQ